MTTSDPKYAAVKDAGLMYGLSTWEVHNLCEVGEVDSHFHGRTRLVSLESLDRYIDGLPTTRPKDPA